jgi:hypothetical protein
MSLLSGFLGGILAPTAPAGTIARSELSCARGLHIPTGGSVTRERIFSRGWVLGILMGTSLGGTMEHVLPAGMLRIVFVCVF